MKSFILMLVLIKFSDTAIVEVLVGSLKDTRGNKLTNPIMKNTSDGKIISIEHLDEPHGFCVKRAITSSVTCENLLTFGKNLTALATDFLLNRWLILGILLVLAAFVCMKIYLKQCIIVRPDRKIIKVYYKLYIPKYSRKRKIRRKISFPGNTNKSLIKAADSFAIYDCKLPERDNIPQFINTTDSDRKQHSESSKSSLKNTEQYGKGFQTEELLTGTFADIPENNCKDNQDKSANLEENADIAFQRRDISLLGMSQFNSNTVVSQCEEHESSYDCGENYSLVAQFDSLESTERIVNDCDIKVESEQQCRLSKEGCKILNNSEKVWSIPKHETIDDFQRKYESTEETHLKLVKGSIIDNRTESLKDTGVTMNACIPSDTQSCPLPARREDSAVPLRITQNNVSQNVHVIEPEEEVSSVSNQNLQTQDKKLSKRLQAFVPLRSFDLQDRSNQFLSCSQKSHVSCPHSATVTLSGQASCNQSTGVDDIHKLKEKTYCTTLHHKIRENEVASIVKSFFSSKRHAIMRLHRRRRRRALQSMLKYLLRFCRQDSMSSGVNTRNPDIVFGEPPDNQNPSNCPNDSLGRLTATDNGWDPNALSNPSVSGGFDAGTFALCSGLNNELIRLGTFSTFRNMSISAIRLAQKGWYFSGESDMTVCFFCRSVHFHWQEGDDPTSFHDKDCSVLSCTTANSSSVRIPEDDVTERPQLQTTGDVYGDSQEQTNDMQMLEWIVHIVNLQKDLEIHVPSV